MSKDQRPGPVHGLTAENLLRTFPMALAGDPTAAALAQITARLLASRPPEIDRLRIYPDIGRLDEALLDILAYDFKVDWWDPDYSLEEKRRTLSDSWRVHKMLGTRAAVETAIRAIYPKTEVKEWFEYEGGKPYHFKLFIDLSGEKWSEARPRRVLERVEFYKSLRSHLEEFQFTSRPQEPAVLHMGGVLSSVISIPIPEQRDRFAFGDTLCLGGGTGLGVTIPLPEQRDGFDFQSALAMGGGGGMQLSAPVPQEPDKLRFDGVFRGGGKPAVRTAVPIPEA